MKRIKYIFAITLSLLLTGCYPTGEFQSNSGTASQNNSAFQNEKFSISADLPTDIPKSLPIVKVDFKKFDNKKMIDLLLNGETIIEMKEDEQTFSRYVTDKSRLIINNSAGILSFDVQDEKSRSQSYYLSWMLASKYIPKEFPNSMRELDDFPVSEALSRAKELTNAMDLKNLGEPEIYSVNADDVNGFIISENNKQNSDKSGSDISNLIDTNFEGMDSNLSSEDSFYYITFPSEINGIEISDGEREWNGESFHHNSNVSIVITKNRVVSFECFFLYEKAEIVDNFQINVDANNAAAKLSEYHNLKKSEDYYEFNQCNIRYITSEYEYEKGYILYKPVWQFSGWCDDKTSGYSRKTSEFVDMKTGAAIV